MIKIVLYGPESTGKTTLAKQLATHYKTSWVPEYMREYLEKKWEKEVDLISMTDLVPIAQGQLILENEISRKADQLLICDTNLLELKVYSEYYYNGFCPEFIKQNAVKGDYDFYLLTYIDIPWEEDILRDRPNNREEMFRIFESELKKQEFPYQIVRGNKEERFIAAVKIIDDLLKNSEKKMNLNIENSVTPEPARNNLNSLGFSEKNRQQIQTHGLSEEEVEKQINIFKKGIPFVNIVDTASVGKGIEVYPENIQREFVDFFESQKDNLDLVKFVPASGAATRMFKFLHRFLEKYNPEENLNTFLQKPENKEVEIFYNSYELFAFSDTIFERIKLKHPEIEASDREKHFLLFVQEMMGEDGLNFSHTPKGLIPFHKYGKDYITAFGEQLYEAAFYASSNGNAKLHFTVSEEYQSKFKNRYSEIKNFVQQRTKINLEISYSSQKKETDTIAATLQNEPFLDQNGDLLFRPSGHGALLDNLNTIDADIVFIKNIDNVVSEKYVEILAFHKKVLAGRLLSIQKQIFYLLEKLTVEKPSNEVLEESLYFIATELKMEGISKDENEIIGILDRPLRVCGVVENTGAPGGGPFIIKNREGGISFQIVEMSQIDIKNPQQKILVDRATHFNPVDLVCGVRNYKGKKFDLSQFADPDTGFISEKSYLGTPIKALELPGLWNGAMANWNTVFVEVPLITFNPVKTVNDLLNEAHRSE